MSQAAAEFSQRMKRLGEKASEYMKLRGFSVTQHNGQRISTRILGKEPTETERIEVFVGKIPRDMFEDALLPVFEVAGRVYKIRLMMDFSCTNRGFAFIKYMSSREAERACASLNEITIRPDSAPIGVLLSFDNKRLYFGNLPLKCTKERLAKELSNYTSGIQDIELPEVSPESDRRLAFVTFVSHEAATQARRIFVPGDVKMFGRTLTIDWAKTDKTLLEESALSTSSAPSSTADSFSTRNNRSTPMPLRTIDHNNNCSIRNRNSSGSSGCNSSSSSSFNCNNYNFNNNNNYISSSFSDNVSLSLSNNSLMSHAAPTPPPARIQLQSPASILGVKTWQMLESCLPNAPVEHTKVVTVCNINLNMVPVGHLKRIFELFGRLKMTEIQTLSFDSIRIVYQSHEDAENVLQALLLYPKYFERLALPGQVLSAYRGSIYSI